MALEEASVHYKYSYRDNSYLWRANHLVGKMTNKQIILQVGYAPECQHRILWEQTERA